jgi:hypothetical protein
VEADPIDLDDDNDFLSDHARAAGMPPVVDFASDREVLGWWVRLAAKPTEHLYSAWVTRAFDRLAGQRPADVLEAERDVLLQAVNDRIEHAPD